MNGPDLPEQTLNVVLFSGTDDKLQAAAVLAAGAAGRPASDLDPLVEGLTAFYLNASGGQIVFI